MHQNSTRQSWAGCATRRRCLPTTSPTPSRRCGRLTDLLPRSPHQDLAVVGRAGLAGQEQVGLEPALEAGLQDLACDLAGHGFPSRAALAFFLSLEQSDPVDGEP